MANFETELLDDVVGFMDWLPGQGLRILHTHEGSEIFTGREEMEEDYYALYMYSALMLNKYCTRVGYSSLAQSALSCPSILQWNPRRHHVQ